MSGTDLGLPRSSGHRHTGGADLPVLATHRRLPRLAALAVVLILGGAVLSATLVLNSGEKQSVIVVTHVMTPGELMTWADIEDGRVAASSPSGVIAPLPWSAASRLVTEGYRAKHTLDAGVLLTSSMVDPPGQPTSCVSVPLRVPDGGYPAEGLARGDRVRLLYVPATGNAGLTAELGPDGVLVEEAYVGAVRPTASQDGATVSVVLIGASTEVQRRLARAAVAKAVYLVVTAGAADTADALAACY